MEVSRFDLVRTNLSISNRQISSLQMLLFLARGKIVFSTLRERLAFLSLQKFACLFSGWAQNEWLRLQAAPENRQRLR
jgi:hypothetical protein